MLIMVTWKIYFTYLLFLLHTFNSKFTIYVLKYFSIHSSFLCCSVPPVDSYFWRYWRKLKPRKCVEIFSLVASYRDMMAVTFPLYQHGNCPHPETPQTFGRKQDWDAIFAFGRYIFKVINFFAWLFCMVKNKVKCLKWVKVLFCDAFALLNIH